jgi:hypothetical protein
LPAYPNPAKSAISLAGLFGTGNQYTKLKIVVVDPFYNVAIRGAVLVHGPTQVLLNLSGNFAYQKNGIYRIYYSLSALNNPNYKMGYGDFQICPGYLTTPNCP